MAVPISPLTASPFPRLHSLPFPLQIVGLVCVGQLDINASALVALEHLYGKDIWRGADIKEFTAADKPFPFTSFPGGDVDLLFASPPCQSFSLQNRNRGGLSDANGAVLVAFFDALEVALAVQGRLPDFLVLENVLGFARSVGGGGTALAYTLSRLQKLGYRSVGWRRLNAVHLKPVRRERIFVVACRKGDACAVLFPPASLLPCGGTCPPTRRCYGCAHTAAENRGDDRTTVYSASLSEARSGPSTPAISTITTSNVDNMVLYFPSGKVGMLTLDQVLQVMGFPRNLFEGIAIEPIAFRAALKTFIGDAIHLDTAIALLHAVVAVHEGHAPPYDPSVAQERRLLGHGKSWGATLEAARTKHGGVPSNGYAHAEHGVVAVEAADRVEMFAGRPWPTIYELVDENSVPSAEPWRLGGHFVRLRAQGVAPEPMAVLRAVIHAGADAAMVLPPLSQLSGFHDEVFMGEMGWVPLNDGQLWPVEFWPAAELPWWWPISSAIDLDTIPRDAVIAKALPLTKSGESALGVTWVLPHDQIQSALFSGAGAAMAAAQRMYSRYPDTLRLLDDAYEELMAGVAVARQRPDFFSHLAGWKRRAASVDCMLLQEAPEGVRERPPQRCGACSTCTPGGESGRCMALRLAALCIGGHSAATVAFAGDDVVGLEMDVLLRGAPVHIRVLEYDPFDVTHRVRAWYADKVKDEWWELWDPAVVMKGVPVGLPLTYAAPPRHRVCPVLGPPPENASLRKAGDLSVGFSHGADLVGTVIPWDRITGTSPKTFNAWLGLAGRPTSSIGDAHIVYYKALYWAIVRVWRLLRPRFPPGADFRMSTAFAAPVGASAALLDAMPVVRREGRGPGVAGGRGGLGPNSADIRAFMVLPSPAAADVRVELLLLLAAGGGRLQPAAQGGAMAAVQVWVDGVGSVQYVEVPAGE